MLGKLPQTILGDRLAFLSLKRQMARWQLCSAPLAPLGSTRLRSAPLGSLGSARLPRLRSAPLGSTRLHSAPLGPTPGGPLLSGPLFCSACETHCSCSCVCRSRDRDAGGTTPASVSGIVGRTWGTSAYPSRPGGSQSEPSHARRYTASGTDDIVRP